jgi:hypothetical protein
VGFENQTYMNTNGYDDLASTEKKVFTVNQVTPFQLTQDNNNVSAFLDEDAMGIGGSRPGVAPGRMQAFQDEVRSPFSPGQ